MIKCFVTGATGFIGSNLTLELVSEGFQVKALVRPASDLRALDTIDCERVTGDISDARWLATAMRRCDWCFHVAVSYHLWMSDYRPMYQTNVEGTRNVLTAAAHAGCSRVVYTSTVGCIGLPTGASGNTVHAGEEHPVAAAQLNSHYKRSKWQAQQADLEMASNGLPVVVVNPSAPVGPRDLKPTPTGRIILDFLNRRMPAYMDTGLNWVHVRDVAVGHILAARKGRIGEQYILGNADGNGTLLQTLQYLSKTTGLASPKLRLPYATALGMAQVSEVLASLAGRPPRVPLAGVRMARNKMFFNPAKAIRELGLPQTPTAQAMDDAVEWFKQNGFVRERPLTSAWRSLRSSREAMPHGTGRQNTRPLEAEPQIETSESAVLSKRS